MAGVSAGFLIQDVSRMRNRIFDHCMKPLGIGRAQWWILVHLDHADSSSRGQTTMARKLNIGKVAFGRSIDCLEHEGLISKLPDQHDRRLKRCVITPKGSEMLATMAVVAAQINARVAAGIGKDIEQGLVDALLIMKHNLIHLDVAELASAVAGNAAKSRRSSRTKPRRPSEPGIGRDRRA